MWKNRTQIINVFEQNGPRIKRFERLNEVTSWGAA